MDIATRPAGGERLYLWLAIAVAMAGCVLAGAIIGQNAIVAVIVLVGIVGALLWIFFARDRWWVLLPMAGAMGGYFYFGHKVFTNEVALLSCLAPLAIGIAMRDPRIVQKRPRHLPLAMYLLSAYLAIHWVGSNIYNWTKGNPAYGNVARVYLTATGVVVFILLFRRYGSTKYVPLALFFTYIAALFRVFAGLITYFTNGFAYLPVINYVLPGSTHSRGDDLRSSGLILLSVALCYFLFKKGVIQRSLHLLIIACSCVALALGGGRANIVLGGAMLLFAALLYRKTVPLAAALAAASALVIALNANPRFLNPLPTRAQRAFSILLLDQNEALRYGKTTGSDLWHEDLRALAYQRWTQSWNTVLFGTGIRPAEVAVVGYERAQVTEDEVMDTASRTGAYESGWWTVLAVTGIVGLVLYLGILVFLLRSLFPALIKNKVCDHAHAFAFIAVFGMVNWLVLGWGNGTFPSTEIMFGFLGVFALAEQQRHQKREIMVAEAKSLSRTTGFALTNT
jgi:hypothetical protein